jgi:hypothetical protein
MNLRARRGSEMNLELFFGKIPPLVKLIAVYLVKLIVVYLLSIVSYFILDFMVWYDIVSRGLDPIVFISFIIARVVFAYLVSRLVLGSKESDISNLRRDIILAIIVFGVPVLSFTEVLMSLFGIIIKIPLPPYVSIMQSTIIMALLYDFPRLVLLICIRLWYNIKNERAQSRNL